VFRRGDDAPASSNDRNAASMPLVAPARLGIPDHAVNSLRLIQLKVLPARMTRAVRESTVAGDAVSRPGSGKVCE
jgi:hypothetical protein